MKSIPASIRPLGFPMNVSTLAFLFSILVVPALLAAPKRRPSYEPPLENSTAAAANLLLNADTTASGQWGDHGPELAVNGVVKAADHWACENLPVWHQVNLAVPSEIAAVRVWPYWRDERVYQFKVEGSLDGNSWMMLGDMTANSITSSPEGHLFVFAPVKLRHIRTTFLSTSNGNRTGGHLVEIEAYTSPPAATTRNWTFRCALKFSPQHSPRPASGSFTWTSGSTPMPWPVFTMFRCGLMPTWLCSNPR